MIPRATAARGAPRNPPSELKADAKLHHARATAAEAGVALGHIRGLGNDPGGTGGRIDRAVRINPRGDDVRRQSEIRMIEDVEELGPQLQGHLLANFEVFGNGEVEIHEAGAVDLVATQIAGRAIGRVWG